MVRARFGVEGGRCLSSVAAGRGHSKRHSQTGLARVRGDVRLAGWRPVAAAAVRQGVAGRAIGPGHDRTGLPKASAVADAV